MKHMWRLVAAVSLVMFGTAGSTLASVATYSDFDASVIRNGTSGGFTTSATSDNVAQTFTITAVGGGKVAIATSVSNGYKLSDFVSFEFSNSVEVTTAGGIVYPNMWVTDGSGHYALLAVHYCNTTTGYQDDLPVYTHTVSVGMDETYLDSLAVRVYATDTSNLNWLFPGVVQMSKAGSWTQSLWKSSVSNVYDPVTVGDLGNLYFGSPFTTDTIPGVAGNSQWTYVGTGDPQMTETFFLMCGDTSGSVQNMNYTLSNLRLEIGAEAAVPEPISLVFFGTGVAGAIAFASRRRRSAVR